MGVTFGLIIIGILSAIIAGSKGFKPFRWLISGLIGLIVVACLSSAKAADLSPGEAQLRAAKGNSVGAWMCGLCIGLSVVIALANA